MSNGLTCAYCREPLPEEVGPNHGFCRCPVCRRILFVKERLLGMRVGADSVHASFALWFMLMVFLIAIALLGWAISSRALLLPWGACFTLCSGVYFIRDGCLSVVTKVNRLMGQVTTGTEAVVWGGS